MTFEIRNNDRRQSGFGIDLISGGTITYGCWEYEGAEYGQPDDKKNIYNSSPLSRCISILDAVAKRYPEVYRAVYEHIQNRTEYEYKALASHCREKNNDYARKFTII